jgi:transcriptional regulator with XRE-family HTH domain
VESNILQAFGDAVRANRLQRKWTQESLAWKTGFHPTYIGRIERGQRNLSLKNIEIFAKAFDIRIEALVKGL